MRRMLKFRFWCNEHGYVDSGFDTPIQEVFFNQRGELGRSCPLCFKSRPMTLEQFTGLDDSEGKPVCEGDIVDFTYWWFDGDQVESHLIGAVVYLPQSVSFGLRGVKNPDWIKHIGGPRGSSDTAPLATWMFDGDDFKVLGNVHEHPDLLEGMK